MSGGTAGQREGHLYTDIKLRLGKISLLTSLYEKKIIQVEKGGKGLFYNRPCPCPLASPCGWGVGSACLVRPCLWPGHGEQPAPPLQLPRAAAVSISFNSTPPLPFIEGARSIFSCPVSGQPLVLSRQPCDCRSVPSACLRLLSERPGPFGNAAARSWTPPLPPCPQTRVSPLTSLFPGAGRVAR